MPTKAELEKENTSLARKVGRLEDRLAAVPAPKTVTVVKEVIKEVVKEPPVEVPSPVDRRQLYVMSHPILGVISRATVTEDSIGDGRIGDGATIVREHA